MMTNSTPVVDVEGLRMRYGATDVLHGIDFRLAPGEVVCLLGPNGAGKTTTVEILEGFRMRSAGRVDVLGEDPATAGERWRARVGIVLQSWRDHGKWGVAELLAHLGTYYRPYATPWDAAALIAAVGLTEQAGHAVRNLSGGQRRRLDVAIGLVGRPELVFLDEPTAGLDPEARREFHTLVRTAAGEHGSAVLLTTHDLDEAERLADRILILDAGRIIADGTVDELARQIVAEDEVRWTLGGERFTRITARSTELVRSLFEEHGAAIADLEVRRSSLEDTYLALVREEARR